MTVIEHQNPFIRVLASRSTVSQGQMFCMVRMEQKREEKDAMLICGVWKSFFLHALSNSLYALCQMWPNSTQMGPKFNEWWCFSLTMIPLLIEYESFVYQSTFGRSDMIYTRTLVVSVVVTKKIWNPCKFLVDSWYLANNFSRKGVSIERT